SSALVTRRSRTRVAASVTLSCVRSAGRGGIVTQPAAATAAVRIATTKCGRMVFSLIWKRAAGGGVRGNGRPLTAGSVAAFRQSLDSAAERRNPLGTDEASAGASEPKGDPPMRAPTTPHQQ